MVFAGFITIYQFSSSNKDTKQITRPNMISSSSSPITKQFSVLYSSVALLHLDVVNMRSVLSQPNLAHTALQYGADIKQTLFTFPGTT